ncbi:MAG: hypothetical protein QY322_03470 [bacterium]|nr:MAG: hypothetical protein QY322_03470 [bacterium]
MSEFCRTTVTLAGENGLTSDMAQVYAMRICLLAQSTIGVRQVDGNIIIEFECQNVKRDSGKCAGKCLKEVLQADGHDTSQITGCIVDNQ